ncbi:unnamed protein product [Staurois parvus]|uniref:Uncharacterized protein n=1 Tax=Staurois parvus TaxID=386267 RepID=A0ABN9GWY8_9NEOB|nr:unnamed protein product [Staurois parvus]
MFNPAFSDPPLLPVSPKYLLIEQRLGASCTCSVLCFFFLGRVHVIRTGQISTGQIEVRGYASS